jgi:hypothetical protein
MRKRVVASGIRAWRRGRHPCRPEKAMAGLRFAKCPMRSGSRTFLSAGPGSPALEFGHFSQNSVAEANPQGWQRVAGGRSGQRGNDHRKGIEWCSTPDRGARPNHLTTERFSTPGHLARSSHSKYLALGQRQSRARAATMSLAPRPVCGTSPAPLPGGRRPKKPSATSGYRLQPFWLTALEYPNSTAGLGSPALRQARMPDATVRGSGVRMRPGPSSATLQSTTGARRRTLPLRVWPRPPVDRRDRPRRGS